MITQIILVLETLKNKELEFHAQSKILSGNIYGTKAFPCFPGNIGDTAKEDEPDKEMEFTVRTIKRQISFYKELILELRGNQHFFIIGGHQLERQYYQMQTDLEKTLEIIQK